MSKTKVGEAYTANGALSNASTGSARINFYFKSVRALAKETAQLHQFIEASWAEDPLDTLKIIFHNRDCRGGKGEKKLFEESVLWLAKHHPETLKKNIKHIPFFGTWKDMLILLPTQFADDSLKLFAEQLKKDLEKVNAAKDNKDTATTAEAPKEEDPSPMELTNEEQPQKKEKPNQPFISLAAKWAPTEKHGNDKKTGSALKLALLLSSDPKTALRDYRKNYLVPLRAHLKIIERFTCAREWDQIPYSLVPSRCMALSSKQFKEHDKERFEAYLEDVKSGKSEIKGKQMMPHELVDKYFNSSEVDDVVELQWKVLVAEARKMGTLTSSLVLSDVSGSMSGTPMMVSVALGLLISEITAAPFTNSVITFHEDPTFHIVKGSNLMERVKNLKGAKWGGSTNFQAVFDMILKKAVDNKVPASHMPNKLFVISDMQFNSACGNTNKFTTNHEALKQKYRAAGYEIPQIIYWNVAGGKMEFPTTQEETGVAMVSGFSPSILKTLLAGEILTPFQILRAIIDNARYNALQL